MKLHVVIDVEHALGTGMPLVGGALRAWPYGPVVGAAYQRVRQCIVSASGKRPLERVGGQGRTHYLMSRTVVDKDDFTPLQLAIFDRAWNLVKSKPFDKSQRYFHGEDNDNAIGFAWKRAKTLYPQAKSPIINWWDIFEGADKLEGRQLSHVRALAQL